MQPESDIAAPRFARRIAAVPMHGERKDGKPAAYVIENYKFRFETE